LARGDNPDAHLAVADAELLRGQIAERLGDQVTARSAWQAAATAWPKQGELKPHQLARKALLLERLGRRNEAEQANRQLGEMGYRHPAFTPS
jgi:hypothetical protein